jgi:hypothetical protein
MPSDLARFDLSAMLRCGLGLRSAAHSATELEAAADAIVHFLHDEFREAGTGTRQLALARFYRTQAFETLDAAQRIFAEAMLDGVEPDPAMRCLCLVATAGTERTWNDRRKSRGHQAIPLPDPEVVERAPMIAQLVRGFGLELAAVVNPGHVLRTETHGRTYGVFHVERALGSPYIPAQEDFVVPHRVASVVGFGGALRAGDIFAVILFSRTPIRPDVADRFRSLALDVKAAIFNFDDG